MEVFLPECADPENPRNGRQLTHPPLKVRTSPRMKSLVGSDGTHYNRQYFLIKLTSLSGKFLSSFIFFCHRHHMECFLFSDLRICLPSLFLCAWSSSIPFLPFAFYLFFCWIYTVVLVLCLGIRFQKWLPDFIYHCILHQLLRSCLPGLRAFTLCTYLPDREASLIKKEYCRCGTHPLQVTSSRVRLSLVKGAGHIGPRFPRISGLAILVHGLRCTVGTSPARTGGRS